MEALVNHGFKGVDTKVLNSVCKSFKALSLANVLIIDDNHISQHTSIESISKLWITWGSLVTKSS